MRARVCVCVCVCGVCVWCVWMCVCVCQRIGHVTATDVEECMLGEIRGSCHCVGLTFETEF